MVLILTLSVSTQASQFPRLHFHRLKPGVFEQVKAKKFSVGLTIMQSDFLSRGCAGRGSADTQSESGSSRYSPYIISRCSNRMGANAASVCVSRTLNAARVVASILHCSGGNGSNIAANVAL